MKEISPPKGKGCFGTNTSY